MPQLDFDRKTLKSYIKNIGGKDYLTVAGRVVAAHGALQLVGSDVNCEETDRHYRCKATVQVLNTHLPGFPDLPEEALIGTFTGYSQSPKTGGKSAEGTNPFEVAETSALGRALGAAGFGVLESIATVEEIETAQSRQSGPTAAQKKALLDAAKTAGLAKDAAELAALAQSTFEKAIEDLTAAEVVAWTNTLNPNVAPPF